MKRSILLPLLALASCGTMEVHSNYAPNANFAQYRTYAWLPLSGTSETEQLLRGSPAEQAIKADVGDQLTAKGIVPATNGRPDFLIAYHIVVRRQANPTNLGYS